jgi:integrase/recombinase XerD
MQLKFKAHSKKYSISNTPEEFTMHELNNLIDDFIFHCRYEKNLSSNTIKAYQIDLAQFTAFTSSQSELDNPSEIDKYCIKSYIKHVSEKNKPKTVKRKIATLKAFFNHLEFEDIIDLNPFHKIRIKIHEGKQLPRTIDRKIINKLFKYLYSLKNNFQEKDRYSFYAIVRDIAVLELLFATGLRIFELCNLKKENIHLKGGYVKISGKGNKERIIPICSPETIDALKEYFYLFKKIILHNEFFFINRLNQRLSEQSVRFMIKKYSSEIRIDENITPHMFRHSIATMLLENGVDIRYIQDFLGHSSISTTQIYAKVNREASRRILNKKHPRNNMRFSD